MPPKKLRALRPPRPPRAAAIKRKRSEPETPEEENETPFLVEIIPDGDVILVVGPDKVKIRVSSHLLRTTSPVFNVMLGPNFKEGAALRENEGPTEIALPEDNAKALWNVYRTLYGAHPYVNKLQPDEIYEISILAHKYDLADRLALACEAWFGHTGAITSGSTAKRWKMLLAAYWLRSELGFKNTSQLLVADEYAPLYRLGMGTSDRVLGLRLCLAIQEIRTEGFDEMGLCLSCFESPATEQFSKRNPHCTSKYADDVLP